MWFGDHLIIFSTAATAFLVTALGSPPACLNFQAHQPTFIFNETNIVAHEGASIPKELCKKSKLCCWDKPFLWLYIIDNGRKVAIFKYSVFLSRTMNAQHISLAILRTMNALRVLIFALATNVLHFASINCFLQLNSQYVNYVGMVHVYLTMPYVDSIKNTLERY